MLVLLPMHLMFIRFFFLMTRRPPRSTLDRSSAASDVYKRQALLSPGLFSMGIEVIVPMQMQGKTKGLIILGQRINSIEYTCLLYTSDAADERSSVDLGGRRIIKKKTNRIYIRCRL